MAMGGEGRELLLQLLGVALGALGFVLADEDGFELVAALFATVFKNWHNHSTGPCRRVPEIWI